MGEVDDAMRGLRLRLYRQLTRGENGAGTYSPINRLLAVVILLSVCLVVMDSEPALNAYVGPIAPVAEALFGTLFLLEYVMRLWVCVEDDRYRGAAGRLRYAVTPAAIIDLLALAPLLLPFIGAEAYILRLVRLLRIVRLTKLGRYTRAASAVARAMHLRRHELAVSFAAGLLVLLVSATCLYVVEGGDQPEQFGSIPRAMWWSVATLTTVGYGDIFPITPLGKVLAGLTAVTGIGLIAVPTGLVASAFTEVLEESRRARGGRVEPSASTPVGPQETPAAEISAQLERAGEQRRVHAEINAGEVWRTMQACGSDTDLAACCRALGAAMQPGDELIHAPPSGVGEAVTIRFRLPRPGVEGQAR